MRPFSPPHHDEVPLVPAQAAADARRDSMMLEWLRRGVFGLLMAMTALIALIAGGGWFAGFIALGTIAAAREWHRLISKGGYWRYWLVTGAALAAAMALPVFVVPPLAPSVFGFAAAAVLLAAAAAVNGALAAPAGEAVVWEASGPLYLGIPALSLFALRATPQYGMWLVLLLFLSVWGCDTGAFLAGRVIGGPKLAPKLSPSKTWAGFLGGLLIAGLAAAAIMAILGDPLWRGVLFGGMIGLISHGGDMFESWVKRRMGRKDSGNLIPGHGGVLDRIDSILFAAPACAAFVLLLGAEAIFGGFS